MLLLLDGPDKGAAHACHTIMVGMLYNPRAIPRLLQDHRHISASLPHSSKSIKSPVINTNQLLLDMATMEKKDNLGGVVVQNEDMKI